MDNGNQKKKKIKLQISLMKNTISWHELNSRGF